MQNVDVNRPILSSRLCAGKKSETPRKQHWTTVCGTLRIEDAGNWPADPIFGLIGQVRTLACVEKPAIQDASESDRRDPLMRATAQLLTVSGRCNRQSSTGGQR
jgi:hypothetical protein